MELRQLRYFAAIAHHGSFSKAAESVFVAQSALSHQVAQLEAELGARLLHRLPRGVTLTESGRAFLPHALSMIRQENDARASVRGPIDQPAGKVVFGVPPSICGVFALPLLQAVRRALPMVDFELTEELSGSLAAQLRAGTLDLAVLLDDGELDQYRWQALLEERLYLISGAGRDGAVAARGITLRKALAMPLLLPRAGQGVRPILEAAAQGHGLPPPHVVGEINSVTILRSTLQAGIGHTIQALSAFKSDIETGLLRATPVRSPEIARGLATCHSRNVPLSSAAAAVLALAREVAKGLVADKAWPGAKWQGG